MSNKPKSRISWPVKRLITLIVMGAVTITSTLSVAALSKRVIIIDRGQETTVITINKDVEQILEQAGITLGAHDTAHGTFDTDDIVITINRAFEVPLSVDGRVLTAYSTGGTVEALLKSQGISLGDDDLVCVTLQNPETQEFAETALSKGDVASVQVSEGAQIAVMRRQRINLTLAGAEPEEKLVPEGSVQNALAHLGIEISEHDLVNVDVQSYISPGMSIRVDKVEYKERQETEEIAYDTITTVSESVNEGQTDFIEGEAGEKTITFQDKIVNGALVESKELGSEVTKAAKNAYKIIGIKPVNKARNTFSATGSSSGSSSSSGGYIKDNTGGTFKDKDGKIVNYSAVLAGSATAYTAKSGAVTSTGRVAKVGNVAVNPNIIPYGSKLYICTPDGSYVYGYAVAADTGGALMDKKSNVLVDLYMDSENACYAFGRRNICVYIVK